MGGRISRLSRPSLVLEGGTFRVLGGEVRAALCNRDDEHKREPDQGAALKLCLGGMLADYWLLTTDFKSLRIKAKSSKKPSPAASGTMPTAAAFHASGSARAISAIITM